MGTVVCCKVDESRIQHLSSNRMFLQRIQPVVASEMEDGESEKTREVDFHGREFVNFPSGRHRNRMRRRIRRAESIGRTKRVGNGIGVFSAFPAFPEVGMAEGVKRLTGGRRRRSWGSASRNDNKNDGGDGWSGVEKRGGK